jgi:tetratricopeptide (TPR) repeat protein
MPIRRRWTLIFAWTSASWLAALPVAEAPRAHGDVHARIERANHQVEREPGDATHYLTRAALYRDQRDWGAALADLDRAAQLDPRRREVDFQRGRVLLDAGRPEEATAALEQFLRWAPDHPDARAARARALLALGRPLEAAADLTRAIEHQPVPLPERYLERARALAEAEEPRLAEAIRGLDEGLDALGPLLPLGLYAVELEVRLGRFDAALARLEGLGAGVRRQETWLARRARILEGAGRHDDARVAYEQADAAIRQLTDHQRETPAMKQLSTQIREADARLGKTSSPGREARASADRGAKLWLEEQ